MGVEKESILITGGCGFLGQHLANDLVRHGYRVVLFDVGENRSLLEDCVDAENCTVIRGDVTNFSELMDAIINHKVNSIIHTAAALTAVGMARPYQSIRVNIFGTCQILEAARLLKLRRITFISSGAVYDPKMKLIKCTEDLPFSLDTPMAFYGCAKASCEMIGLKYTQMFGVDFVSARCAGIYGRGVTAGHYMTILVKKTIRGKKIDLKKGGDHRFEFIYVKDTAQGVRKVHTAPQLKHCVYNIGIGQNHSLFEVAEKIRKYNPSAEISIGPGLMELPWVQRPPMDISRAKELGYQPEYDLDKGVAEFIKTFN